MNVETTSGLIQRWVSVVDTHGRDRLQGQWVAVEQAATPIAMGAATTPATDPSMSAGAHAA